MNFDAMSRAGCRGADRIDGKRAAGGDGRRAPPAKLVVRESTITHPRSKKSMTFAEHRQERQRRPRTFTPDELKAIKAEDRRPVHRDRAFSVSPARHSVEDQRNGPNTASTSCCPGMVYGRGRHALRCAMALR